MSIEPDFILREWAQNGGVTPYEPKNVGPSSIDLRRSQWVRYPRIFFPKHENLKWRQLHDNVRSQLYDFISQYRGTIFTNDDIDSALNIFDKNNHLPADYTYYITTCHLLTKYPDLRWTDNVDVEYLVLEKGDFVLLSTLEYVNLKRIHSGSLYLRSTLGRMGAEHLHAGYVDPAFPGHLTLEMVNVHPYPIVLRTGDRIVQLVLDRMTEPPELDYVQKKGNYVNQQIAPQPARGNNIQ